jgi:hypothetical protein
MSSLERDLAVDGYAVVGVEALRTGTGREAVLAARDESVDVLFVIDEYSVNVRSPDQLRLTDITFYEEGGSAGRKELIVGDVETVGRRCAKLIEDRLGGDPEVESATLAVKMVNVGDGRTQWIYRKTVGEGGEREDFEELRYPVKSAGTGLVVLGTIAGVLGAGSLGTGAYMNLEGTSLETRNTGAALAWGGGALLGTGLILALVGAGQKVPPESVLCHGAGASDAAGAPGPAASGAPRGTRFTLEERRQGSHDRQRELRERLARIAVEDFVAELRNLSAQAPRVAAAPRPTDPHERCRSSPVCSAQGRCQFDGVKCVAGSPEDCRRSDLCRREGACGIAGQECVAASDADCKSSELCAKSGACALQGTRCAGAPPPAGGLP